MEKEKLILKVLVGSRAHGLANEDSDYDYRGVFVAKTTELLKLNSKVKSTHWIEGNNDDTTWELSHFLHLSIQSNPTILETYVSPVVEWGDWGEELRGLFPYVWSPKRALDAFIGYGHNQRKKFLDNKDSRPHKYAAAYLRVLYNLHELLTTGTFNVNLTGTPIYETVKRFKEGNYEIGEVISETKKWEDLANEAFKDIEPKEPDIDLLNEFLLKVRKEYW